ncbi:unnamed protein product [Macrosiphum euphorbiae]|uniref:DUF4806 domain-containing protein n=1 Tax=Macrosiphum euphorbiae TaxID=13131 RepID=A0AAV0XR33_9HEMI|nr:unnamed protein product [Macrosiphum euphorbiae]
MYEPSNSWTIVDIIRVLASYDDFLKAKLKLREAEYKTDLESDDADKAKKFRKIKAAKINSDSDDSTFETQKITTSLQTPCAPPQLKLSKHISNNSGFRSKQLKCGENNFSYKGNLDILQKSPDLVEESYDITFLENINGEVFLSSARSESNRIDDNTPVVFLSPEQSQQNMEQRFENIVRNENGDMNNLSNLVTVQQKDLKVLVENSCHMKIKINQMLIVMKQMHNKLNRCLAPITSSSGDTNINIRSYFPLKDETQLDYVDTMILENAAFKNQLMNELSIIGGDDIRSKTYNAMKYIFSNKLATVITYAGMSKEKKALKNYQMHDIILDAVRSSCQQGTTNRDIIRHIMSWFKHAIDRYRNEYKRQV